jgi:hypothetical protein
LVVLMMLKQHLAVADQAKVIAGAASDGTEPE